MKKLKEKLDAKESRWFILTTLLFIGVFIVLEPKILTASYLHAEDGGRFLNEYFKYGLSSFAILNGGYLCTISRLFVFLGVTLAKITKNLNLIGLTINYSTIIFTSIIFAYFSSNEFASIIKNRFYRILVSLLCLIFLYDFVGVVYNGVGIHWVCGFLAFIVGLNLLNNKLPSKLGLVLVLISIISSVSSLILAFPIIYYLFKKIDFQHFAKTFKNISKKEYLVFGLIAFFGLLQVFMMLFSKTTVVANSITIKEIFKSIYYSLKLTFASFVLPISLDLIESLYNMKILKYVAFGLFVVMLILTIKNDHLKKYFIYSLLCVFVLYFMVFYKHNPLNYSAYYGAIIKSHHSFYKMLPCLIMVILYGIILSHIKFSKKYNIIVALVFLFIAMVCYTNKDPELDLSHNKYLDDINKYVDFQSHKYAKLPCEPYRWNWYVFVPVKEEYCQNNKCYDDIEINVFSCDRHNVCQVEVLKEGEA